MNRSFIRYIVLFLALFMFSMDVKATMNYYPLEFFYTEQAQYTDVDNKEAIILCEYADDTGKIQSGIYFKLMKMVEPDYSFDLWNVLYRRYENGILTNLDATITTPINASTGSFETVFINEKRISYQVDEERYPATMEDNFVCAQNQFVDFTNWNELCFGDYNTCGANFGDGGPYRLVNNGKSIYHIINKYAEETVYGTITLDEYKTMELIEIIKAKTITYLNATYSFGSTYFMPDFVKNYVNSLEKYINIENSTQYESFVDRMEMEIESAVAAGTMTEEEAEDVAEKTEQSLSTAIGSIGVIGVNPSDDPNCSGLLGTQMTEVINNIFSFVQYLGPVLVAVLTIVDFFKASVSGEKDDINKATKKLVKRAICAVLLFFVPLICSLIFSLAGITVPEICIGK